jgi:hypothetical protein
MRRSRINLLSISAALSILILVMTGAAVTSSHGQARLAWLAMLHTGIAIAVALLVIGLTIAVKRLGGIVLLVLLPDMLLGYVPAGPVPGALHAILAAFLFAAAAAIALVTSPSWERDPESVQDHGWPSLKSLSTIASFLVAIQVGFGASLRHGAVGVMPHLLGALLVALFIVIVGVFTTTQFPKHPALRPLAVTLLAITGVQVFLGMTVFLMRMMNIATSMAWLGISVVHVATGSLTFTFSVLLAIEIRRNVRSRAAQ